MGNVQAGARVEPAATISSMLSGAASAEEVKALLEVGLAVAASACVCAGAGGGGSGPQRSKSVLNAAAGSLLLRPLQTVPSCLPGDVLQAKPELIYTHTKLGENAWHFAASSGDAGLVEVVASAVQAALAQQTKSEKVLAQVRLQGHRRALRSQVPCSAILVKHPHVASMHAHAMGKWSWWRPVAAAGRALPAIGRAASICARRMRAKITTLSCATTLGHVNVAVPSFQTGQCGLQPSQHGSAHNRRGHDGNNSPSDCHSNGPHD
jgi:hypothetical protein